MRFITPTLIVALFTLPLLASPPLIVTGWDSPTPAQFRKNVAEFEKWGLFDGTTIKPTRRSKDGNTIETQNAFSPEEWKWEEFVDAVADLREAKQTSCRETFLMLYSNPGNVDWFDDMGWKEVVNHWRFLARLARQGGLRGLLYDAEPYVKPYSQFRYLSQPGRGQHTFAEYRDKARERGREVMRAVGEEFPDVTIFSYRLFSDMLPMLDSGNIVRALEPDTYGLQPAFVDGWMDVMPKGLTIIEGTEDIGYRANSRAEYNAAFTFQRLRLHEFLSPENREKYSRCLRIGQSLYLDAHINPTNAPWHIDSTGSSPASRLSANLSSALAASDGLVWIYGEKARWWPDGNQNSNNWPAIFPNAINAIFRAKDPNGFARSLFTAKSSRTNLLSNGDFAKANSNTPDGWFTWQPDDSHGTIICADSRLTIGNASEACVGYIVETKPGAILAAHLRLKVTGVGQGSLVIGWKTSDGKWTAHAQNARFFPREPADADDWREINAVIEVPPTAGRIVFMASASAQTNERDRCEFDNAELVAVP
jgi:hypothetical protein